MDYESLGRAEVRDGRLHVAGESFGVVVVPAMRAIRHSSLEKLRDFVRDGGMVINIGPLPEASEKGAGATGFSVSAIRRMRPHSSAAIRSAISRCSARQRMPGRILPSKRRAIRPLTSCTAASAAATSLRSITSGGAQRAVSVHGEPRSCGIRGRAGNARCGLPPSRMPEPRW